MPVESLLTFCTIIIAFLMLYVALRQMHGELHKEISSLRVEIKQDMKGFRDELKSTDHKIETLILTLFNCGMVVFPENHRQSKENRKSA